MTLTTIKKIVQPVSLAALVALFGCEQQPAALDVQSSSISVQFDKSQQAPVPRQLAAVIERVRLLSGSPASTPAVLAKSSETFIPNEARIAVLDATRWANEEELLTALSNDSDTLYNYSSVTLGGDLWDNMVALFRGYTGETYRFGGEYYLPVLLGAGRGVISANPGLNMFFASLREGKRTVYLFFAIQMISAEGENRLTFSAYDVIQRLLSNVGMWDPATGWHALGGGTNGEVLALEFVGGNLVVGGSFTAAGSVAASNVAVFDTVNKRWQALGAGLPGPVCALTLHGGALYALSNSRPAVTTRSSGLFIWNGAAWAQVGQTFNDYARTLLSTGTDLYVGGDFTQAGAVTLNHLAVWADTSVTFSPVSGGTNGPVFALASGVAGAPLVYVGGAFTSVGVAPPLPVSNIALVDIRSWATVGTTTGITGGLGSGVRSLLSTGTELYAGGFFLQADAVPVTNVALYNGNTWVPLGGGINGPVRALASDGLYVYAGGLFRTAEGFEVNNIAVWYGFGWYELGSGLDGPVNAIQTSGPLVFVGGNFAYTK